MARRKVVTEMSNEQVAYYSRELMNSSNPIEEMIGTAIWEAIYTARNRVDYALLTVNRMKGVSLEQDEIIDQIRAKLDTKYAMPEAPASATVQS